MNDLRSKFKGAKLSKLKDVQKDAEANKKSFYENDGRVGFLSVDDGRNVFRIMPAHPDDKIGSPYLPCRRTMLKCEVEVYKDGEATGQTEVKNKYIFIATQHGGLERDPIELYIEYVRKRAEDEFSDKNDRQKFLAPITGWKGKDGKWNWGIIPGTSYVAYAVKNGVLGRIELWESWVKEMDKLSISEDPDDVMQIDPFSDPNEGAPLIITRGKNDKGKTEHTISKDEPSRAKRESWEDFFERTKVSDAHLEELIKQKPLSEMYGKDVYTTRDFDLALDGLRRFDEENKYNIFDNEEFLEELEKIQSQVPEPKDNNDDIREAFNMKSKPKEEVVQESDDNEDQVELPIIKRKLKKYVVSEYGEEFIDQIPNNEVGLRKWYSLYENGDDLPIVKPSKPEKVVENKPIKPIAPAVIDSTGPVNEDDLSSEIAKLRARRNRQS